MKKFIFYYQTCYATPENQALSCRLIEKFGCKAVRKERHSAIPFKTATDTSISKDDSQKEPEAYQVHVEVVNENTTDFDLRILRSILTYLLGQNIFFFEED